MRGFVDFFGNVAPTLSLKLWDLFREARYNELDELLHRVHYGPQERTATLAAPVFSGVADGPLGKLRWELMGLHSGPLFPAQATQSTEYVQHTRKIIDAPGSIMEWVDWDQSVLT